MAFSMAEPTFAYNAYTSDSSALVSRQARAAIIPFIMPMPWSPSPMALSTRVRYGSLRIILSAQASSISRAWAKVIVSIIGFPLSAFSENGK
ncbi:hypothetical protein SDC9_62074 [bioreactor metagenome]|uniref:Uncharacterized protein n=1 Tax=bioreactor metagenome TaxID=1076179 RepID=A0A644XN67_9ZZZZ